MPLDGVTDIYDDIGRLVAVIGPAGDSAVYSYDRVGNLLSVERHGPLVVSIIEFTPKKAPAGASVTIHGTGFSTTPGQNAVTFNGVPGTVASATATEIVAIVPSGSVSGLIAVTTPTGSATSTAPFTVIAAPAAPIITGFNPKIGEAGSAVTITGAGFDPVLVNNKVGLNASFAALTSAAATIIGMVVPAGTASGRISASTPIGKAVSSDDFFVPPVPHSVTDVEFTARMELRASIGVSVGGADKIALVVFDGTAGQRVGVGLTDISFQGNSGVFEVSILDPHGLELLTELVGGSGEGLDLGVLPKNGTYTIFLDSLGLLFDLALTLSEPILGEIEVGAPSSPINLDTPGQHARFSFDGTAGQRVNLGVSEVSFGTASGLATISILKPDGTKLTSKLVGSSGDDIDTDPLPETGIYTVLIRPDRADTVDLTLTLSEPLVGSLVIDGPLQPVSLDRPGQDARVNFEGAAGQRVNLGVSDVSFGTASGVATISILQPDGTKLTSSLVSSSGDDIDTGLLPDSGMYTIVVDPEQVQTVSLTLSLTEVRP